MSAFDDVIIIPDTTKKTITSTTAGSYNKDTAKDNDVSMIMVPDKYTNEYKTPSGVSYDPSDINQEATIESIVEKIKKSKTIPPYMKGVKHKVDNLVLSVYEHLVTNNTGIKKEFERVRGENICKIDPTLGITELHTHSFGKDGRPLKLFLVEPDPANMSITKVPRNNSSSTANTHTEDYRRQVCNISQKYDICMMSPPFFNVTGLQYVTRLDSQSKYREGYNFSKRPFSEDFDIFSNNGNFVIKVTISDNANMSLLNVIGSDHTLMSKTKDYDIEITISIPVDTVGPGVYFIPGYNLSFVVFPIDYTKEDISNAFAKLKKNPLRTFEDLLLFQMEHGFINGLTSQVKCIVKTDNPHLPLEHTICALLGGYPCPVDICHTNQLEGIHQNRITFIVEIRDIFSIGKKYMQIDFDYDAIMTGHVGVKKINDFIITIGLDYDKAIETYRETSLSLELDGLPTSPKTLKKDFIEMENKIDSLTQTTTVLEKTLQTNKQEFESTIQLLKKENAEIKAELKMKEELLKRRADNSRYEAVIAKSSNDVIKSDLSVRESEIKTVLAVIGVISTAILVYQKLSKDKNKLTSFIL
jgi:hypothetical protein